MWGTRVRDQDFESGIANLNSAAAQSNERAAELEKQTAELKREAEAAKAEAAKANERILKMQQMRRLEKHQAEALVPLLKSELFQKEPKPALRIGAVADVEAQMYAMEFQRLFESCGVNIYPTDGGLPNACVQVEPNQNGMVLTVKNLNNTMEAFSKFQQLMFSIGLPVNAEAEALRRDNEAVLHILRKP